MDGAGTDPMSDEPTPGEATTAERGPSLSLAGPFPATVEPDPDSRGRTSIADVVVAKVAGVATREVRGVHGLGSGAARALGSLRERIPGQRTSLTQGVAVEVGARQAAVDIDLVVEYGFRISAVADEVRQCVIRAIEELVGLEVIEVNVAVNDVHLPSDDVPDARESRVQ